MTTPQAGTGLRRIRDLVGADAAGRLPDRQLLERFTTGQEEEAFAALVKRHGPLVFGVCRRVLHNWHDAEDVFQATFLTLARKAPSIAAESVAGWLHRVAYRAALQARARGSA